MKCNDGINKLIAFIIKSLFIEYFHQSKQFAQQLSLLQGLPPLRGFAYPGPVGVAPDGDDLAEVLDDVSHVLRLGVGLRLPAGGSCQRVRGVEKEGILGII